MNKIPVVAVVGPTASGKTALAVSLAKKLNAEVISFDSMQIYKNMHIASAAPDLEELCGIPHHLIEFVEPDTKFSVADFVKKARTVADEIALRKKNIIIVGGTGLYINSFIDNIIFEDEAPSEELRKRLNAEFDEYGGEEMLKRLKVFDKESAERLHPNNKKRIIRAFEIYLSSGITMTTQIENSQNTASPYIPYMLGLNYSDRSVLYEKINIRVDEMVKKGLLEEAKHTYMSQNGGTSVQAIGHKEFFPYFDGEVTLEEAVEQLKASTRRYAKRQLTWFRRDERINWIYRDVSPDVVDAALNILERNGYFEQTAQNY